MNVREWGKNHENVDPKRKADANDFCNFVDYHLRKYPSLVEIFCWELHSV